MYTYNVYMRNILFLTAKAFCKKQLICTVHVQYKVAMEVNCHLPTRSHWSRSLLLQTIKVIS